MNAAAFSSAAAAALLALLPFAPAPAPSPNRGDWLRQRIAAATPGSTIDVPAGEYHGQFVLDRPVHLRGVRGAVLRGDGTTHVVAVRAADVTVEGFEIRNSGLDLEQDDAGIHVTGPGAVISHNLIADCLHGVYVRQADDVRVEDNTIVGRATVPEPADGGSGPRPAGGGLDTMPLNQNRRGNGVHVWRSSRLLIARNTIRDTRDGVYFSFADRADVRDNLVTGVRYGLHYMYSDENRFDGNVFRDNAAGAALMYSKGIRLRANQFVGNRGHRAYGLLLQSVDGSRIEGNRIAGNSVGLYAENSHGNEVVRNRVLGNHVGVRITDSSDGNVVAGNTFAGNIHTVETSGPNTSNRWSSDGRGNFWDDGMRLDLDGNGVVDLPHRELDLFGGLRREFPEIGLLAGSPGERLLRFVHARLAIPGLPGIVDPAPLVQETAR